MVRKGNITRMIICSNWIELILRFQFAVQTLSHVPPRAHTDRNARSAWYAAVCSTRGIFIFQLSTTTCSTSFIFWQKCALWRGCRNVSNLTKHARYVRILTILLHMRLFGNEIHVCHNLSENYCKMRNNQDDYNVVILYEYEFHSHLTIYMSRYLSDLESLPLETLHAHIDRIVCFMHAAVACKNWRNVSSKYIHSRILYIRDKLNSNYGAI